MIFSALQQAAKNAFSDNARTIEEVVEEAVFRSSKTVRELRVRHMLIKQIGLPLISNILRASERAIETREWIEFATDMIDAARDRSANDGESTAILVDADAFELPRSFVLGADALRFLKNYLTDENYREQVRLSLAKDGLDDYEGFTPKTDPTPDPLH